jgi:hypothetical protein
MNQREKLQAQLEILQQMKEEFPKQFCPPFGEKYTMLITQRENGILLVQIEFDQNDFEKDIDGQAESFFNQFINELENNIEEEIEKESFAFANSMELVKRRVSLESDNLPNI